MIIFHNIFFSGVLDVYKETDLSGLSPPPPGVTSTITGYDFTEVQCNSFPIEFSQDLEVQPDVLYKKRSALPDIYTLVGGFNPPQTSAIIEALSPNATYDVFVGTVNNVTLLPGSFSTFTVVTGSIKVFLTHAPFCSELYKFTGPYPNVFGDKDQQVALQRMRTFFPLYDTGCSAQLRAFMCSTFLPPYNTSKAASQKPCQSLCQVVRDRCSHAIKELKFKWPVEIDCDKLPTTNSCYGEYSVISVEHTGACA